MKKRQKKAKKRKFKSFCISEETVEKLKLKKGNGKTWERFFQEIIQNNGN